jgi:ornithine cyclodeaminase
MIDYIGMERIQELVSRIGPARFIEQLAGEIEADYRRWPDFDKSPRHAAHSPVGVIELMPVTDGQLYSFKLENCTGCKKCAEECPCGFIDML